MPDAFLFGLVPFFVFTVSSRYYWACLALLPLLARPGPSGRRRVTILTVAQLTLLTMVATAELFGLQRFSLYSLFDLLLAVFFTALLLIYLLADLQISRRKNPLENWYQSRALAVLFFVCLFLLLCWLRMPDQEVPIRDVDESVSALIAASWLEGGIPYRDAIDQRGPVTYLIYAAVFAVTGIHNMAAVHWTLLLLILGTCAVVFRLGKILHPGSTGIGIAYLATFLLAVATFTYRRSQMLAFHTEWPMMLFNAIAMLLLWSALKQAKESWRNHFAFLLAGVCFALGFLSKQPGIFDAAAGGLFVLLWQHRDKALFGRRTVRIATLLAAGFFSTLALTAGYFAWHGALHDFIFYYWTYNVEHYTAVVSMTDRLSALNPFIHRRHYLTANPLLLIGSLTAFVTAAIAWLRYRRVDGQLLVALWFVAGYFAASYSGRNFGHYFIQIIVPACLATAIIMVHLWFWLSTERRRFRHLHDVAIAGRGLLLTTAFIALVIPVVRFGNEIAWRNVWHQRQPDKPRERLLQAIRQHSSMDETIFVRGYYPELYVLAPRRPASPLSSKITKTDRSRPYG